MLSRGNTMAKKDVEQERVRISNPPPANSPLKRIDDVFIVVSQAFCPNGHNLVDDENEKFDGYPGIRLKLTSDSESGDVYLSPFHGDSTKKGQTDWENGTKFKIKCPMCDTALPILAKCHCSKDRGPTGDLIKLFLSPGLTDSHIMAVCNVWGCRKSRTIDNWHIISEYLDGQISD